MKFEVWTEGHRSSDGSANARLVYVTGAVSFADAVKKYVNEKRLQSYYSLSNSGEGECHSVWGCRLFDNEENARESFG